MINYSKLLKNSLIKIEFIVFFSLSFTVTGQFKGHLTGLYMTFE